jgi:ADP-L-glycero-D-manno-heptose 6-epimerase
MPDRPTYIVTGGAGFVGANLVAALLSRSPRPRVIVLDNFRSGSFANIVEACERRGAGAFDGRVVALGVADLDWNWLVATEEPAAMFHLGAITDTTFADERVMIHENVTRFDEMMRACVAAGRPLVYASSAATYGTPPQARDRVPFPVEAAGKPNNVYGFSKCLLEGEHRQFAAAQRTPPWIVGLRYFNVFGPHEARKSKMASMVYQLAQQMLAGKRPRLFTDGSQARDQVYVDDVVDCTLAAAGLGPRNDPAPGIYNLGSGVATSFNQIVAALRGPLEVPEKSVPTEYFEMPPAIRAFYQDYTCADMTATERGLGWKPRWKPEQAIGEYGAWLKSQDGAR